MPSIFLPVRLPSLRSAFSNGTEYTSYSDGEEDDFEGAIPPPPPSTGNDSPPPPPPSTAPPATPSWADDVSGLTTPSVLSTAVQSPEGTPDPKCEIRINDNSTPSRGTVELELAIYDRIEKSRRVEADLAKDEQSKRSYCKQKMCIGALLLLAVLSLVIALAKGLNRADSTNSEDKVIEPVSFENSTGVYNTKTYGPTTIDDLSLMLVGVPPGMQLEPATRHIFEEEYCDFFVRFYNTDDQNDTTTPNIDVTDCKIKIANKRRRLQNLAFQEGLVIFFSQTLTLSIPGDEDGTATVALVIESVAAAPLTNAESATRFTEQLRNLSHTDAFSTIQGAIFVETAREESFVSADPTAVPTIRTPITNAPTESPTITNMETIAPAPVPTPKPTKKPTQSPPDKDKNDKNKKKKDKD